MWNRLMRQLMILAGMLNPSLAWGIFLITGNPLIIVMGVISLVLIPAGILPEPKKMTKVTWVTIYSLETFKDDGCCGTDSALLGLYGTFEKAKAAAELDLEGVNSIGALINRPALEVAEWKYNAVSTGWVGDTGDENSRKWYFIDCQEVEVAEDG